MRFIRPAHRLPLSGAAVAAVCVLASSLGACSVIENSSPPKQTMTTSPENKAGEGTVQAKAGSNGNTDLEVRVKHLAAPSKLAPDATVYVVWIKPRNAPIQNVGALEVDSDLTGKLDTTTPQRAFTLSVTPEANPRATAPTHQAVFTTEVNRTE